MLNDVVEEKERFHDLIYYKPAQNEEGLDNTKNKTIEKKRDSSNLILNAKINYKNAIYTEIKKEVDTRVPKHIDDVKLDDEIFTKIYCTIRIPKSLFVDIKNELKNISKKDTSIQDGIINVLEVFRKTNTQHHVASSYLKYDGKKPRIDVLRKLQQILRELYDVSGYPSLRMFEIEFGIKQALPEGDPRVHKKYATSIRNFAKSVGQYDSQDDRCGLETLNDTVARLLEEKRHTNEEPKNTILTEFKKEILAKNEKKLPSHD